MELLHHLTGNFETFSNMMFSCYHPHAQKRLFSSFQLKIWPSHSPWLPRCPIGRYICTIRWRLRYIFHFFVRNFYMTLWPWPSTF